VVTCDHGIQGMDNIFVKLGDKEFKAKEIIKDANNDIAIIKIEGTFKGLKFCDTGKPKMGDQVFTIGFPNTEIQGANPKFTKGEISSISGIRDEPTQWQISVPVQSGNSGSPLFDESGNVVGIVVSKLNALETAKTTGDLVQNVNYAVKNAYLIPMLEKFTDKLPSPKQRGLFKKFESVVEDSKKTVVLILAY